jgi:hypothetical protein
MTAMGFMHVDEALRLANERQTGLRREARRERSRSIAGSPGRGDRIRGAVARFGATLRDVDATPLPRLLEYSYRP